MNQPPSRTATNAEEAVGLARDDGRRRTLADIRSRFESGAKTSPNWWHIS